MSAAPELYRRADPSRKGNKEGRGWGEEECCAADPPETAREEKLTEAFPYTRVLSGLLSFRQMSEMMNGPP